ncbi:Transmembrane protein 230 [Plasmodiophora brassicae]|uniref:Transmembrane protein 230 n=1 Tax=Plasmodiophora brassicae TaxID=37360 RepID=A0A0G4J7S5_PLABS|nr:hypothetical protein PBRA_003199 [Plasmodiophora brassicae]SPQ95671.1 unnamed protein product [Plasmodiophora brassicae]
MVRRERLEDDDAVGWDSVSASIPDPVNVEVPQSAEHYDDVRLLQKEARRLPRRTACVAVLLLVVGLVCFISGLASIVSGGERVYTLLILGSVLMIPGGYQSYVLYHSWRGTPGFSFDQVPSYDD